MSALWSSTTRSRRATILCTTHRQSSGNTPTLCSSSPVGCCVAVWKSNLHCIYCDNPAVTETIQQKIYTVKILFLLKFFLFLLNMSSLLLIILWEVWGTNGLGNADSTSLTKAIWCHVHGLNFVTVPWLSLGKEFWPWKQLNAYSKSNISLACLCSCSCFNF